MRRICAWAVLVKDACNRAVVNSAIVNRAAGNHAAVNRAAVNHAVACCALGVSLAVIFIESLAAQTAPPTPILNTVFPSGGQVGKLVEIEITGAQLSKPRGLRFSLPGVHVQQSTQKPNRFAIRAPRDTPPGLYELRAITANGVSTPRVFWFGNRGEELEAEPNNALSDAQLVDIDRTINGRISKKGDIDCFRFEAKVGQRVVIECRCDRLDSRLRAVLTLFDQHGRRLAANRGYFGVDPLIDFRPQRDGEYFVKVHDLIYSGGPEHYYRLDIDTGPRVAYATPAVVQQGKASRVRLHGWNLASNKPARGNASRAVSGKLDQIELDLPPQTAVWPLPLRLAPNQSSLQAAPIQFPGSHSPLLIGVTDLPVVHATAKNDTLQNSLPIPVPCEINSSLSASGAQDWFAIDVKRGEVLYFEGMAARIGSPLDLDIRILQSRLAADGSGAETTQELAHFSDSLQSLGGVSFPTSHLDPVGRWVAPRDGRYFVLVRDLTGGQSNDPRRQYRLAIRRETPGFSMLAIPRDTGPASLNVIAGGRIAFDLLAFRQRGHRGALRIRADQLPAGFQCEDVWLGPEEQRGVMILTASPGTQPQAADLLLRAVDERGVQHQVRGGVIVRKRPAEGWGRLTAQTPIGVTPAQALVTIIANAQETRKHHLFGELAPRYSPGGILDVAVQIERGAGLNTGPVSLLAVGLPQQIQQQTSTIPAGADKGYISFYLPPHLPLGRYSFALEAKTDAIVNGGKPKPVHVVSNAISFDVREPAFRIEVDSNSPTKIRRGEVIQVAYTARRLNGFISKIHTELASPGRVTRVVGLRARGVTFVGQTEQGKIQIVANEDAPLGRQPFLRLYAVGVLEDQPMYHGSAQLDLEIVE